jgi:hypothetical protein
VALEHMESKLSNSVFVDALAGGVLVYAGGDVDRPVAFVQVGPQGRGGGGGGTLGVMRGVPLYPPRTLGRGPCLP